MDYETWRKTLTHPSITCDASMEFAYKAGQESIEQVIEASKFLLTVKIHKDTVGKDEWYLENQPKAWERLSKAIRDFEDET